MLLITTSILETWQFEFHSKTLYVSEACKPYSLKGKWAKTDHYTPKYHWNDSEKIKADLLYLEEFYEQTLGQLSVKLNSIHNVKQSKDYWRIIVGPWLINYLPMIFDRLEQLRSAYLVSDSLSTVDLNICEKNYIASDFEDFIKIMQTDEWNHLIYLRLIKHTNSHIKIINARYKELKKQNKSRINITEKVKQKAVFCFFEALNCISSKNNKYYFNHSYFKLSNLFSLNIALGQFPGFYYSLFKFQGVYSVNEKLRNDSLGINHKNNFEQFINKFLLSDIPRSCLENFDEIDHYTKKLSLNPQVILTANSYWGNDVFKIWLAQMRLNGKKLLLLEHGGAFPFYCSTFDHEEKSADKFISWFIPHKKLKHKQTQLPPNKINIISSPKYSGKYCSYLGFESVKYGYRLCSQPTNTQVLESYEMSITFHNKLYDYVQDKFVVRPYPDQGWETEKRYQDTLGPNKVKSSSVQSFKKFINQAKVIVCSYPQTTFSEAMASGRPVMLVYNPKYHETIPEAEDLLNTLKAAKILFYNPHEAANHLNQHWYSLEDWWSSQSVVQAKDLFFKTALRIDANWKKEWVSYLRKF